MPESSSTYQCSIFAHELVRILKKYSFYIYDLTKDPFNLKGREVDRLLESLKTLIFPTLHFGTIRLLVRHLLIKSDDELAIYAALIAVGTQSEIKKYFQDGRGNVVDDKDCEVIWHIADEVREAAFRWLKRSPEIVEGLRTVPEEEAELLGKSVLREVDMATETDVFQEVSAAYDRGIALATLGFVGKGFNEDQMLFRQAREFLLQAQRALSNVPPSLRETEDGQYWQETIAQNLELVTDEILY